MGAINKKKYKLNRDPLVSVVVTTKNEERVLKKLLSSIKAQTYQKTEIIVVDNASDDATKEVARNFTNKVYDFGPERSAQRNYGAKKAKGSFLLFLDADMELSRTVIEDCLKTATKDKDIGGVIIPEKSVAKSFWEKVKAFERSFYNLKGDTVTDAARFIKKEAFKKVGGYDEKITGPEDWDLSENIKKLGYKIARVNSVIYHHERVAGLLALAKKKYYYALKAHRYLSKQKIPIVGPKTVYFLRPVFWRNWKRLVRHPLLSLAMWIMFIFELLGGGLGFVAGKIKKI